MVDQSKRTYPYFPLRAALSIAKPWLNQIVEIGGIRGGLTHPLHEFWHPCCNDGHSTYHLMGTGAKVLSIDNNKPAHDLAVSQFGHDPRFEGICLDGLSLMELYLGASIDFLFLDGLDINYNNSAKWHFDVFNAAQGSMSPKSFVLIDDSDVYAAHNDLYITELLPGGKASIIADKAESMGWQMIFTGRMTLYAKGFQQ